MSMADVQVFLSQFGVDAGEVEDLGGGVYACPPTRISSGATVTGVREQTSGGRLSLSIVTASVMRPTAAARRDHAGSAGTITALITRCATALATHPDRASPTTAAAATRLIQIVGASELGLIDLTLDQDGDIVATPSALLDELDGGGS